MQCHLLSSFFSLLLVRVRETVGWRPCLLGSLLPRTRKYIDSQLRNCPHGRLGLRIGPGLGFNQKAQASLLGLRSGHLGGCRAPVRLNCGPNCEPSTKTTNELRTRGYMYTDVHIRSTRGVKTRASKIGESYRKQTWMITKSGGRGF